MSSFRVMNAEADCVLVSAVMDQLACFLTPPHHDVKVALTWSTSVSRLDREKLCCRACWVALGVGAAGMGAGSGAGSTRVACMGAGSTGAATLTSAEGISDVDAMVMV